MLLFMVRNFWILCRQRHLMISIVCIIIIFILKQAEKFQSEKEKNMHKNVKEMDLKKTIKNSIKQDLNCLAAAARLYRVAKLIKRMVEDK